MVLAASMTYGALRRGYTFRMQPPAPSVDRPFDVLGIGATSVDFVYQLPAYPSPTASLAKMRITQHFVSCGGQVATALATCASLGLRAKFCGVTGTDDNAKRVRRDLDDRVTDRTMELVSAVTFPMFAEHVPSALTGVHDPVEALRVLRRSHPGILVVTLGIRGAIALEGDRLLHLPAFAVDAVDTTGAGDVFRGAFIYGYLQGWPLDETMRFANAAAAVSCSRLGAMASVPTHEAAERLLVDGVAARGSGMA